MTEPQPTDAEKLEAARELGSSVAHNFNNVLQVIVGNLEVLRRALEREDAATREATLAPLEAALRAASEGAQHTRRLLEFARKPPEK